MNLGEFRELTKSLPDDIDLIIDARANYFGNCWSVLAIEATSVSSFGVHNPAIKLSESNPSYAHEDTEDCFFIHPTQGRWIGELAADVQAERKEGK